MKRLTIAISLAVVALPLCAQVQQDSPLVAAAKASGRVVKKAKLVITNDTLVHTGGHIGTVDSIKPIAAATQTTPYPAPASAAVAAAAPAAPVSAAMSPVQPPISSTTAPPTMTTTQLPVTPVTAVTPPQP